MITQELADVKKAYQELIDNSTKRIHKLELANGKMVSVLFDVFWEYERTGKLTPGIMEKIQKGLKISA